MTAGGWIFMLGSVAAVFSLAGWCFYRVLTLPPATAEAPEPEPSHPPR